jgi:hypothetical protein
MFLYGARNYPLGREGRISENSVDRQADKKRHRYMAVRSERLKARELVRCDIAAHLDQFSSSHVKSKNSNTIFNIRSILGESQPSDACGQDFIVRAADPPRICA